MFTELAKRPQADIAQILTSVDVAKISKNRAGVAAWAAGRVEKLAKNESPAAADYETASDRLLPERFPRGAGVAFVMDVERDSMEGAFFTPPPLTPDKGKEPPKPLPPISRLEVVRKELSRALEALSIVDGKGNVILMGEGSSWKPRAEKLTRLAADPKAFVAEAQTSASRDPLKAMERALEDPEVEVIYVLTEGVPLRSIHDAKAALARVHELQRTRRVPVYVTIVFGGIARTENINIDQVLATRKDELNAISAFWGPIAGEVGGDMVSREKMRGLGTSSSPPKPGK
jgi:hypothetical protein